MHELRNCRDTHGFWIEDAVIDRYAAAIGPRALALYIVLMRHADSEGEGERCLAEVQGVFGASPEALAVWRSHTVLTQHGLLTVRAHRDGVLRYTLRPCPDAARAEDATP